MQQNESFVAHSNRTWERKLIDIQNPHNAYHNPELTHFRVFYFDYRTLQNISYCDILLRPYTCVYIYILKRLISLFPCLDWTEWACAATVLRPPCFHFVATLHDLKQPQRASARLTCRCSSALAYLINRFRLQACLPAKTNLKYSHA